MGGWSLGSGFSPSGEWHSSQNFSASFLSNFINRAWFSSFDKRGVVSSGARKRKRIIAAPTPIKMKLYSKVFWGFVRWSSVVTLFLPFSIQPSNFIYSHNSHLVFKFIFIPNYFLKNYAIIIQLALSYFNQNEGYRIARAENASSLPTIIFQLRNHLPASDIKA